MRCRVSFRRGRAGWHGSSGPSSGAWRGWGRVCGVGCRIVGGGLVGMVRRPVIGGLEGVG